MASVFITTLAHVTEQDVRDVFNCLQLGQIDKIDTKALDGRRRKFWIHYSCIYNFVPAVKAFFDKIHINDIWQKDGGQFRPPRIIFKLRNGKEQYWNAYYTKPRMAIDYSRHPRIEL